MAHQFKVKRKDGKGWWTLPHMDQDQIDGLTLGEHTDLHHHDSFYYRQATIDATWVTHLAATDPHDVYVLADGTRVMSGDLAITKDQPGILFTDDGGLIGSTVLTNTGLEFHVDDANAVASSAWDMYIDGGKIFSCNNAGFALWGYVSVINSYLQVAGNESADGTIYLYADQGDENADKWSINANIDGSFTIENYATGGWVDFLEISANKNILMYGGLQVFRGIDATASWMSVGFNRTASGSARLDLIGDTTYTESGLRIIRGDSGENATSQIIHRGTGAFSIVTDEAADIVFETNSISALRIASSGVLDVANSACVLDEDDFNTDSDTQLATQQSIKAYIASESVPLDGSVAMTGNLTVGANYVKIQAPSSGSAKLELVSDNAEDDADLWRIESATDNKLNFANYGSGAYVDKMELDTDGNLEIAGSFDLGSILTVNGTYKGKTIIAVVDDGSTVFGNVLAQASDFHYDRADADAVTNSVGLVMAITTSGTVKVLIEGMICNTSWSWSAGFLYLSTTTGAMTQTAPAGTGDQVVVVGWALSATCVYFKPSLVLAEVA